MKRLLTSILLVLSSCNNIESYPERIDKLRAIGVDTPEASYNYTTDPITLTFLLLSPSNSTLTASIDDPDESSVMSLGTPNVQSPEAVGNLFLYRVEVSATFPSEELMENNGDFGTKAYYGVRFTQDNEIERVKGSINAFNSGIEALFSEPSISISEPTADGSASLGSKVDLKAETTTGSNENYRLSWFVSSGKVEKYRADETEWEPEATGSQAIIATVRGLSSGSFSYTTTTFTVN